MLVFLVPLILSNALQSVGQLVGSIVVGRWLGVTALAAISAFFPLFASQSIGANRLDRLKDVIRADILFNYVIGGVLIILVYLFSQDILSWFITSKNTLYIAHSLLMITIWSYLIFGHAQIITSTMRASGTVLWPTVFGVVSIWCVEVPVDY